MVISAHTSHRVQKIQKASFVLISLLASVLLLEIAYIISSVIGIYFFDHTFVGWFIREDDVTHDFSLTMWSWCFIGISLIVVCVAIASCIVYIKDIKLKKELNMREINEYKKSIAHSNSFAFDYSPKLIEEITNEENERVKKAQKYLTNPAID